MTLRVQISNKCNSSLIANLRLSDKAKVIKRTGVFASPERARMMSDHIFLQEAYNKNQGLATFDIDESLLHLIPNDARVLIDGKRVSAKQYKEQTS